MKTRMTTEEAQELNLSESIHDLLNKIGGPGRHAARVEATWEAAFDAGGGHGSMPHTSQIARLLILADLAGQGGPGGLGCRRMECGWTQGTSARMSWAQSLGKGRWEASDGSAYRSALIDAAWGQEWAVDELISPASIAKAILVTTSRCFVNFRRHNLGCWRTLAIRCLATTLPDRGRQWGLPDSLGVLGGANCWKYISLQPIVDYDHSPAVWGELVELLSVPPVDEDESEWAEYWAKMADFVCANEPDKEDM